jgi:polar amino acid transport system substrate-binding protein
MTAPRAAAALLAAGLAAVPFRAPASAEPPLRVGLADQLPAYATQRPDGSATGFTAELFRAIAERLHRTPVFVPVEPDDVAAALDQRRVDLVAGPLPATPELAEAVLFTEGYLWSEDAFSTRAGAPPVRSPEDLRGRTLGVLRASPADAWATAHDDRYGFAVRREASLADLFAALRAGQVGAVLASSVDTIAADPGGHAIVVGHVLTGSRTQATAALRKGDTELRDDVEDALDCLKQDGTVARLSHAWLQREPGDEDLENMVVPGYGVPGLAGYDPRPHKPRC